jgi:hypothetical protein
VVSWCSRTECFCAPINFLSCILHYVISVSEKPHTWLLSDGLCQLSWPVRVTVLSDETCMSPVATDQDPLAPFWNTRATSERCHGVRLPWPKQLTWCYGVQFASSASVCISDGCTTYYYPSSSFRIRMLIGRWVGEIGWLLEIWPGSWNVERSGANLERVGTRRTCNPPA